jgi:hypothetical protein
LELPTVPSHIKSNWYAKLETAQSFMNARRSHPGVLIEVAAQHPLIEGTTPGKEFSTRLDRGRELFQSFRDAGQVVEIYVPGSRHVFHGKADKVSLSDAGRAYLEAAGVIPEAIHGDDLNSQYKGDEGVYGSADECFVTASYFKDRGLGILASVVSPAQLLRKTLHYIEFGVLPLNYTAPTYETYHNYLDELFNEIPSVLLVDSALQSPESEKARRLRSERRPH